MAESVSCKRVWRNCPGSTTLLLILRPHILLSTTNKMQHYTIFFVIVNAVCVSVGFSAHHQELKNCTHSIWYVPGLLAATVKLRPHMFVIFWSAAAALHTWLRKRWLNTQDVSDSLLSVITSTVQCNIVTFIIYFLPYPITSVLHNLHQKTK
jgi:hypothetical protein